MPAIVRQSVYLLLTLTTVHALDCLKTSPHLSVTGDCGEQETRFEATLKNNRLVAKLQPGDAEEYGDFKHLTRFSLNVGGCEVELVFVPGLFLSVQSSQGFSAKAHDLVIMVYGDGRYSLFSPQDAVERTYKCPSGSVEVNEPDNVEKTAEVSVKLTKKIGSFRVVFTEAKLWTSSTSTTGPLVLLTLIMTLLTSVLNRLS